MSKHLRQRTPPIQYVLLAATFLAVCFLANAQDSRMQLILERRVGKSIQQTSPQHVFSAGDFVRFRFQPSFDGYLYVMDQSTSGKYQVLFPAAETGNANQVIHGKEYLIPASSGSWFRVDNPAGYERIFFLVSPTKLEKQPQPSPVPEATPPMPESPAAELLPRCDDSVFRARGECVDVSAGPRAVPKDDKVPDSLPGSGGATSRDISVINKSTSSVVAPGGANDIPLIYEFRLAHR